jgi:uncharacterized protein (TIGR03790 family)
MRGHYYILLLVIILVIAFPRSVKSQTSYADVAVIVNTNSPASVQIGNYFKSKRGIPAANMIYVATSTAEEIDSLTFNSLRSQIESYLVANNLQQSVNYLVTTKGVPLKINRGNTFSVYSPSASVESELTLILGSFVQHLGLDGKIYSSYYGQNERFSRGKFGIYLVTRLDGYSIQQVLDMIDRSGPGTKISPASKYVFDQDPTWNSAAAYLNDYMATAKTALEAKGKIAELNSDSVYLTSRSTVVGYASWGSNDRHADQFTVHALPYNTWAPGALAETYVSTSGRSFDAPPDYGQSLVADLVQEGISGVKGYVYEPYASAMADVSILFSRYTSSYNLAESYFMASRYLSWMDVVIGDPKTTIVEDNTVLPVQLSSFSGTLNSANGHVVLSWTTLSEVNNYGFFVERAIEGSSLFQELAWSFVPGHGTTIVPQTYAWTDSTAAPGTYLYRLRQVDLTGETEYSDAQRVTVQHLTSVTSEENPTTIRLHQNYPNPFNPTTVIRFQIATTGRVTLQVFDLNGREVASLENGMLNPGIYERTFDATSLSSGTYVYRLNVGGTSKTERMIYLK